MAPFSSCERLDLALSRIADPSGEGARTFLSVYSKTARKAAEAADARAHDQRSLGPLDGVIVSIKDLFDVAGEPTRAGSLILADAPPAVSEAPIVRRLRKAGAVIVGKTNMSEFAFTGVGANPHYGTPGNPADRSRVPGGSSSGAAVAVADDQCEIAIGSDTGGSTRIPAALCGVVGYKPTKHRVPTQGAFPLSPTLDSVGPLARTVQACAEADAILAGEKPWTLEPVAASTLRLGIPLGIPLDDIESSVARSFEAVLARLGSVGAQLSDMRLELLDDMARVQSTATIATVEAYQIHHQQITRRGAEYDPIVRARIQTGGKVSRADYLRMLEERSRLLRAMDTRLESVDALILPTVPIAAPTKEEAASSYGFSRCNRLLLRNTAIANFFDFCAISLPMPDPGPLPAGAMLFGRRGHDRQLFEIAATLEQSLRA